MKIEFVETGKERVILLYEAARPEIEVLLDCFAQLGSESSPGRVLLEELPGCISIDGCSLALCTSDVDVGVEPRDAKTSFVCTLSATGWRRAHSMLEPFLVAPTVGVFQYLVDVGKIEWVISTTDPPGW